MKEVSRSQQGWGPAKNPGGERAKKKGDGGGGQVGGGRERNRAVDGLIYRSCLHGHQEFISSWKGVKEG